MMVSLLIRRTALLLLVPAIVSCKGMGQTQETIDSGQFQPTATEFSTSAVRIPVIPTSGALTTTPTASPGLLNTPTPTPLPADQPSLTATVPAQTVTTVTPASPPTATSTPISVPLSSSPPHQDFPAFLYLSSFSNVVLASTAGTTITPISLTSGPVDSIGDIDWSASTRSIIYSTRRANAYDSGSILWTSQDGAEPVEILRTAINTSIETPRISSDGTSIVYSLVHWRLDKEQLWIVNIDGSDNRLLVDRIRDYITMPPIAGQRENFGLSPVGWSRDNSRVYLDINIHFSWLCPQPEGDLGWPTICKECDFLGCEMEEIDEGMPPKETIWEYDLRTSEFREVAVWKGVLAPALLQIANITAQHETISIEDCPPFGCDFPIPPFSITVTDLITGATRTVMESYTSTFDHLVWSPDGRKIAFSLRFYDPSYINQFREVPFPAGNRDDEGIYIVDLVTREVRRVVPGLARHVHAWLPDDRIVYHSEGLFASIQANGTNRVVVDIRAHPNFFGYLD